MSKGIYIGVNSVAQKVKKVYIGVGGVARRAKKAYVGVDGVARLFWQKPTSVYFYADMYPAVSGFGSTNGQSTAKAGDMQIITGGSVYDYSGGYGYFANDYGLAISKSLTVQKITPPSKCTGNVGFTINNMAYFVKGRNGNKNTSNSATDFTVDESLTIVPRSGFASRKINPSAASTGSRGVLYGGQYWDSDGTTNEPSVHRVDESLTWQALTNITPGKHSSFSGNVGNYLIFAGGVFATNPNCNFCVAFDSSYTQIDLQTLQAGRGYGLSSVSQDHLLMIGGRNKDSFSDTVESFDGSLTLSSCQSMNAKRMSSAGGYAEGKHVIGGGLLDSASGAPLYTEIYDESLVHITGPSIPSNHLAGGRISNQVGFSLGNYVVMICGKDANDNRYSNTYMYVFEVK